MLASLEVFDWNVADVQMSDLLEGDSLKILEKHDFRILDCMHQVYQRLISPKPLNAVIGYSSFIFSNSKGYLSTIFPTKLGSLSTELASLRYIFEV